MPTSTRLALALALALVAPACASTVVPIAPDAAADAPQDVARDVSPDVSPDAPDGDVGPVFPCSAVVVASGFSLLEGMFGTGRVVIDPARRAPVLVSFSSGAIVRVAPDTGALTRFAPPRYPGDVGRAAVFVDEGVGALVVVPLPDAPAAPTQVLSLDLARPDRWETTGIITSAAPSGTPYAVAGFDPTNRSLRVVSGDPYLTAQRSVWDLRFTAGGWGWARRADFVTPRPVEAHTVTWNAARARLLVVTSDSVGPWGLWSVGADASTQLPQTLPREGGAPVVAHDPARRVSWALATTPAGATLTALPDDAAGAVRSVTVGDPMRALNPSTGSAWAAFDAIGRRLYAYADNISGGRTSFLTAVDVDRCLPR
ncbi:MAG: hypothetical protein U0324_43260 [Polyangiales bacterium]